MTNLHKYSESGQYGGFAIEINVDATKLPDLNKESIWKASHDAVEAIKSAIMQEVIANDKEAQEYRKAQRAEIINLFKINKPIFVEEIPNGYCSSYCCKHLPWFVITTSIGRFEIGWRKRVLSIDWSKTIVKELGINIFPNEKVTVGTDYIHAWSLEDAERYIANIFTAATQI